MKSPVTVSSKQQQQHNNNFVEGIARGSVSGRVRRRRGGNASPVGTTQVPRGPQSRPPLRLPRLLFTEGEHTSECSPSAPLLPLHSIALTPTCPFHLRPLLCPPPACPLSYPPHTPSSSLSSPLNALPSDSSQD